MIEPTPSKDVPEIIQKFRDELNEEIEEAIEDHEFKMTKIGIITLIVFVGFIFLFIKI
ncbi:hypothetical protein L3556_01790 [Candidatus Synechococcus calcipolaris G9]|uniref:Uncharacterized protein n=1 Tax=Candidatus Synechococcus calcipolaris G9 TaxID=1497997 RepID=A0ABT6EV51_9SYNE|nr:hypothetical protein [Candidatus Synechococcus calcipolaris]MDG2989670.1 hypothetical protein [Candidatus Synechococcus calcipolaris G9]